MCNVFRFKTWTYCRRRSSFGLARFRRCTCGISLPLPSSFSQHGYLLQLCCHGFVRERLHVEDVFTICMHGELNARANHAGNAQFCFAALPWPRRIWQVPNHDSAMEAKVCSERTDVQISFCFLLFDDAGLCKS